LYLRSSVQKALKGIGALQRLAPSELQQIILLIGEGSGQELSSVLPVVVDWDSCNSKYKAKVERFVSRAHLFTVALLGALNS
jgi:hypothetical protein